MEQLHRQPKKRKGYTLWKRSLQTSSMRAARAARPSRPSTRS
nr:MAG TPA: hypothetical protein [Caudoviricetes sp.]